MEKVHMITILTNEMGASEMGGINEMGDQWCASRG